MTVELENAIAKLLYDGDAMFGIAEHYRSLSKKEEAEIWHKNALEQGSIRALIYDIVHKFEKEGCEPYMAISLIEVVRSHVHYCDAPVDDLAKLTIAFSRVMGHSKHAIKLYNELLDCLKRRGYVEERSCLTFRRWRYR